MLDAGLVFGLVSLLGTPILCVWLGLFFVRTWQCQRWSSFFIGYLVTAAVILSLFILQLLRVHEGAAPRFFCLELLIMRHLALLMLGSTKL